MTADDPVSPRHTVAKDLKNQVEFRLARARRSLGEDAGLYRAEFVKLVEVAAGLGLGKVAMK